MTLPAWVRKRDGRLVPFESDKISRSLFAATEELGRPDAFLARELTDSVLHFLADDAESAIPSTDIAELVVKVVRELGQPALAHAYADRKGKKSAAIGPTEPLSWILADCRRSYALSSVFTRDLVAAHHDGLLTLHGLDAPLELEASASSPLTPLLERLLEVRQHTGGVVVALDGVEYAISGGSEADNFVRELEIGLRGTGLRAVVNLNAVSPPAWAEERAAGPLFAGPGSDLTSDRLTELADVLLPVLARSSAPIRIDWHLSERDFSSERLRLPIRLVAEGAPLAFVFDRPSRPIALAEGIDRKHPARLLTVGLHLPRLAEVPGVSDDPARLLQKLGSLARLALSAAAQKRDFLRRHAADRPTLMRGFFLDRARLMVAPVGLDVKNSDFARQVVQRLRDVLREDGRTCVIDVPGGIALDGAPGKVQLRAVAEGGTVAVPPNSDHMAEWLRMVWAQTEVGRICFVRPTPAHRQLTL